MKLPKVLVFYIIVVALLAVPLLAQYTTAKSVIGFDQLKSLVGEWEGKSASGQPVHIIYQLVSGGTALMERLRPTNEPEMVTVYTADGNRVAATHYCSSNTQPLMRSEPISSPAKEFSFFFVSSTNLADPETGHMDHLLLQLEDGNHLTQQWTWKEKGKTKMETFHLTRKTEVL